MSQRYKLLVFDWDGTLMDSQAEIVYCFQAAAKDLSLTIPSTDAIHSIIGIGMREAINELFPEIQEDSSITQLVDQYRHHYFHPDKVPAELFVGIEDMLIALEKEGYFLAVATSKGRRGLNSALERTGLNRVFHTTRCIDEAVSKPNPQMLLDILDILGVEASDALMIGDTEYDLQMANNAKVDAVGVCCGAHEIERLLACEPKSCLDHTTHLFDWLKNDGQ